MSSKRVKLSDIAKRAEVSIATVSYALKNHPRISKERCQSIQALARSMGYEPDPRMNALSAYRKTLRPSDLRQTVAMLVTDHQFNRLEKIPFQQRIINGAKAEGKRLGYRLECIPVGTSNNAFKNAENIIRSRGIQGVIYNVEATPIETAPLSWNDFTWVSVSHKANNPAIHSISSDHYASMTQLLTELVGLGYQRPLLLLPETRINVINTDWIGSFKAFDSLTPRLNSEHLLYDPNSLDPIEKRLASNRRPDVIIVSQKEIFTQMLERLALVAGKDIGYCELGVTDEQGQISGIYQRPEEMGKTAIWTLSRMLEFNERGKQDVALKIQIAGKWVRGKTV